MPVQDSVVIKVDVDVDGMGELTVLEERFDRLEKKSKKFSKRISESTKKINETSDSLDRTNKNLDAHDKRMNRVNHSHRRFARTLNRVTAPLKKFMMTLSKLSFVALIGQIGLFTVGLLAAKLALITGRAAVQVYQVALKGLSVAAAGVATAVSVAAAALRQFNEAMLIPSVGGGMTRRGAQNSALLSRSLGSRTTGLLGGEATTALLAGLAKAGVSPTASGGIARQLVNLTGGDAAAVQAIAKAIGSKDSAELRSALSGAAGFRSGSLQEGLSTNQLLAALSSGSIVSENYRGVGAGLAGTFIGTAKTEFSGMKNMFADMGQPLLNPFRDAMMDMARIIRENFVGMSLLIQRFGADSFAPTLVTLVEKTIDFIRSNIFDHLENIEQMGESFVGFFRSVRDFFRGIGAFLVQFEPAADVVIEMFRAMGATGGGRGLFRSFSDLVVKNAEAFQTFGASIGNVFGAIFDLLKAGQSGFFGKLDLFSDIMNRVASDFIPAIGKFLEALMPILEQLPNAVSGLAAVLNDIVAPVVGHLARVIGALMGIGKIGGAAGGLGLLGLFLGLKNPMAVGKLIKNRVEIAEGARSGVNFLTGTRNGTMLMGGSIGLMGGLNTLQSGPSGGNTAAMIGGGVMMGSSFGLPGMAVGAAAGLLAASITGILGENARAARAEDAVSGAVLSLRDMSLGGGSFADFRARREEGRALRQSYRDLIDTTERDIVYNDILFGETRGNGGGGFFEKLNYFVNDTVSFGNSFYGEERFFFDRESQAAKDLTAFFQSQGKDLSVLNDQEFYDALTGVGPLGQELKRTFEMWEEESLNFESNLQMLKRTTQMTSEEIESVADSLGIDLADGLMNAAGATAVFAAQMLPLIDRNRAFFPSFSTSPLGQAEARATANAAFTTLANADKLTVDLVRDAFEAFAAYEVVMGVSPDVAGFSSNFELMEQVMGHLSTDNQETLMAMLASGTLESATAMSQAYAIPLERIMQFAGDDRIIGTPGTGELRGIETFLAERSAIRGALNLSSGLTGSERFASLEDAGVAPTGKSNYAIRKALLAELGMSGYDAVRFSTADLFTQVETANAGADTSAILLRSLAESGFFDMDETLDNERNISLAAIAADINYLRTEGITVTDGTFTLERGGVALSAITGAT
jgi:hypothetical protein